MDELSKELHGHVAETHSGGAGADGEGGLRVPAARDGQRIPAAVPAAGLRHLEVTAHRGYLEFAQLMKDLVDIHFPRAETIRVVLDNLNTHVFGALYEGVHAGRGAAGSHGSWSSITRRSMAVG